MQTSSRHPISVYIIAKNEGDRIGRAIRSVIDWVDEVLVIDSGSDDDTVAVAEQCGAKVRFRPWNGYGPQKRFGEEQCSNDWLLMLDADEEVSPELRREIESRFAGELVNVAFEIRVTDTLPGETRPKWFAYSYKIVRLYNRQHCRCSSHAYKDRVEKPNGGVGSLRANIWHHSFRSWEAMVAKLNFYTSQVAEARADQRISLLGIRLFTEFPTSFLQCYVGRRYFLRGPMGLAISITIAYLNLLKLLKITETQRQSGKRLNESRSDIRRAA